MKLGYPVISNILTSQGVTPYRKMEGSLEENAVTFYQNLKDLQTTLIWNEEKGIKFYRVSNNIAHKDIGVFSNNDIIKSLLTDIGNFCRLNNHRLSFHCSHYAVLGSPKPFVRLNARREIEAQSKFFDLLEYEATHWNKINLHIGGSYGDREKSIDNWIESWDKLSPSAKSRLVVENDDKPSLFSVDYLYKHLYEVVGVPITFDSFHHGFCNIGESKKEAAKLAASTWGDIEPCFHFASSRNIYESSSKITAHADWIYEEVQDWGTNAWIMIESAGRDLALLHYLSEGIGNPKEKLILND